MVAGVDAWWQGWMVRSVVRGVVWVLSQRKTLASVTNLTRFASSVHVGVLRAVYFVTGK